MQSGRAELETVAEQASVQVRDMQSKLAEAMADVERLRSQLDAKALETDAALQAHRAHRDLAAQHAELESELGAARDALSRSREDATYREASAAEEHERKAASLVQEAVEAERQRHAALLEDAQRQLREAHDLVLEHQQQLQVSLRGLLCRKSLLHLRSGMSAQTERGCSLVFPDVRGLMFGWRHMCA